jgi:hypothetical protein
MKQTRRQFLKTSTGLIGCAYTQPFAAVYKKKPKLAFSTLGCPKWTFSQIVECAVDNGYQGIEIRGLRGEMDLPKCPEFSDGHITETLKLLQDNNLTISGSAARYL